MHFENAIYRVLHEKKQYYSSFRGAPRISRKKDFYTFTLVQTLQNKINKTRIRAL